MDRRLIAVVALIIILSGCRQPLAPAVAWAHRLELRLSTAPAVVDRGAVMTVRLAIANRADSSLQLNAGSSCLARIGIYRNGVRQSGFTGTDYGCFTVLTTWRLAPGDSLEAQWPVGIPVRMSPTDYVVRLDFETAPQLPALEQRLRIR